MISFWSYRPQLLHLGLFTVAYVLGCGFAQALAIVPGTGISIWPSSGLFIATLVLAPRQGWIWWIMAGCLAELFSNVLWFHSPLPAAVLIYVGNALEAIVGAWLVTRTLKRPIRLETLQEVLAFVVLGAGIAPVVSATIGSATLTWFGILSQTFFGAWPLWWIGDSTGVLIIAPLALIVFQSWHGRTEFSMARWAEASVLGLIFLGVTVLSLSGYLPFAYIIMPPLLWAAVRFEFKGAAVSLALLALITALFTVSGAGQFAGDPETQRHRQIMLQLFLAISAFSALIVAAISRQHQLALATLHQSLEALRDRERELSQLVDIVPVQIRRLTTEGEPTFFNKRLLDFFGLEDISLLDNSDRSRLVTAMQTFVHPEDSTLLLEAVRRSVRTGEPGAMKYRMLRADGVYRWVDGRWEPSRDDNGVIVEWFAISIDIDDEVQAQEALRLSEQKLQQLIDTVPALIWTTDAEGTPNYLNKRFVDVTGATLENFSSPGGSPAFPRNVVHPDDREMRARVRTEAFATGTPYYVQYRHIRRDGTYRWTESRAEPFRNEAGAILAWYAVSVDIHDMVTAQEALRERERELSKLVDLIPSHVWRLTPDGEPVFFNKRMVDFLGLDIEDMDRPGMSRLDALTDSVHAEDSVEFSGRLRHCLAEGESFDMRYRLRRADGTYRWMSSRAEPIRDEGGHIMQWYGLCHDIDDQMQLYGDLAEREARIRRLIDSDIIGIVIWDLDGTLIDANDAFLRMVQYERQDVEAGLRWFDMTPPDWQDMHAREEAEELAATGKMQAREKEYFRKDGSRVPVLIGAACFEGQSRQGVAYILDLTEQKRAETELRNSKRQLEQMIDAVPINILSYDPAGRLTSASKRYLDSVGTVPDHVKDFEALARHLAHPDDLPVMLRKSLDGFATGTPFVNRFRRRDKDGAYPWIEARAQPLKDASGAIVQWYQVSIDIEDEMRAQEALRGRERFLWQLVETLPAMIDCAAPNGEPVYRSQQLREFLGYQLEALDGNGKSRLDSTLDAGVHPDDVAGVKQQYAHCLATGEPYMRKHRLRRFDGEYLWVETRAAPMRRDDGTIVQWNVICLDVDSEVRMQEELRLAQERLARASQAASLAELSASIAHEVNQPLAAIVANSHACFRWLSSEPVNVARAKITTERVIRDANSAAEVVGRIRALFRQSAENRVSVTLGSVISEASGLMADEALRRRVRLEINVESELPAVSVDRIQIQQVLINLIRNGMESMESSTGERVLEVHARRVGNEVQTEIGDRGNGIEFPERIFEPFFTTKTNGMGMGLAICRSIVEAHGGSLSAEKNEPKGARVIFTLPIASEAIA